MIGRILVTFGLMSSYYLLTTTWLNNLVITPYLPDVALIILVCAAQRRGAMIGQISGFAAGIVADVVSLAPLGFHAFQYTLTGHLIGRTKGKFFVDPIFVPILTVIVASLFQSVFGLVIGSIFGLDRSFAAFFNLIFFVKTAVTGLFAPLIFFFMSKIKIYQPGDLGLSENE